MASKVGIVHGRMDANPIVLDESAGDVVVVVVEGEHDIYTAPTLRERLEEALGRGGGIVVDLTGATFVDSSVLGALLDARRKAIEAGQGYVVCVGDSVGRGGPPGLGRGTGWSRGSSGSSTSPGSCPCCRFFRGARRRSKPPAPPTAR